MGFTPPPEQENNFLSGGQSPHCTTAKLQPGPALPLHHRPDLHLYLEKRTNPELHNASSSQPGERIKVLPPGAGQALFTPGGKPRQALHSVHNICKFFRAAKSKSFHVERTQGRQNILNSYARVCAASEIFKRGARNKEESEGKRHRRGSLWTLATREASGQVLGDKRAAGPLMLPRQGRPESHGPHQGA